MCWAWITVSGTSAPSSTMSSFKCDVGESGCSVKTFPPPTSNWFRYLFLGYLFKDATCHCVTPWDIEDVSLESPTGQLSSAWTTQCLYEYSYQYSYHLSRKPVTCRTACVVKNILFFFLSWAEIDRPHLTFLTVIEFCFFFNMHEHIEKSLKSAQRKLFMKQKCPWSPLFPVIYFYTLALISIQAL